MRTRLMLLAAATCLFGLPVANQAQTRLLGITGLQGDDDQESFPDAALFEISTEDGSSEQLAQLTFIPDTHAIGFNPEDGLLYHTGGSESWTDDPGRVGGFRDHQYMETVNLETFELTPIFNANGPDSPDEFPSFGPAAPLPEFILPQQKRLLDDPECEDAEVPGICPRERGDNEYHGIRGLTWSQEEKLFYGSDELGIFKLTPEGQSTFVGQPVEDARDTKGISFYEKDGNTTLLTGTKRNANLWSIDIETGDQTDDPVELLIPEGSDFDLAFEGLLGMAQHPDTGELFGVRRTDPDVGSAFERELITINPATGETQLVGNLGLHFAALAFVTGGDPCDFDGDGQLGEGDLDLLLAEILAGTNNTRFDVNGDGVVDKADNDFFVGDESKLHTYIGDSNLDGEFNSSDFVDVFAAGKYEDGIPTNATWAEGDWDANGDFDSSDFVAAFTDGGYELGPKWNPENGVAGVPEPSSLAMTLAAIAGVFGLLRRSK